MNENQIAIRQIQLKLKKTTDEIEKLKNNAVYLQSVIKIMQDTNGIDSNRQSQVDSEIKPNNTELTFKDYILQTFNSKSRALYNSEITDALSEIYPDRNRKNLSQSVSVGLNQMKNKELVKNELIKGNNQTSVWCFPEWFKDGKIKDLYRPKPRTYKYFVAAK